MPKAVDSESTGVANFPTSQNLNLVLAEGLEPPALRFVGACAIQLRHASKLLNLVLDEGFEPPTFGFEDRRSYSAELIEQIEGSFLREAYTF